MKIKEVMTPSPTAVWLTESLADTAKLMVGRPSALIESELPRDR